MDKTVNIVWLRRDLRIEDNIALLMASKQQFPILLLFIFDDDILNKLNQDDSRVTFIYEQIHKINAWLRTKNSSIMVVRGCVQDIWKSLIKNYQIKNVFVNEDYEPYGIQRDEVIHSICAQNNIRFTKCKDHVIFSPTEILKNDGKPYTVYSPYKKQWLKKISGASYSKKTDFNFYQKKFDFPELKDVGFTEGSFKVRDFNPDAIDDYKKNRDFPYKDSGSYLGPHLRFGTKSIREIMTKGIDKSQTFVEELIWREFFMQILFHYPHIENACFRSKYDLMEWRNNETEFNKWCNGETGYLFVDAGMRELNQTGYMHNRVRMIAASFLTKHLLIDWRWGEAYFARKLLDYELSSNNGNWQWAAGTGCDAAPYFRVFNPTLQQQRFDPEFKYIKKWIPEFDTDHYPQPIVEHKMARERAIRVHKKCAAR